MKKRILPLLAVLTILALAAVLGLFVHQNIQLQEKQSQADADLDALRKSQEQELSEANAAAQEKLTEKDAYIAGQNEYITELSAQLQELMEADEADPKDTGGSPYDQDYPDLYAQAEYDRRNGDTSGFAKKIVHLTFDDGPSDLTPQVLDLLDSYNAKATFFVVYKEDKKYTDYLSEIVARGHTLALHSYSHNYKKIYASVDAFLDDYDKVNQWVYEATGQHPTLYRFPGGSNNGSKSVTREIKKEMARRGYLYYDWNVSSGDGSNLITTENIIDNICLNVKHFEFPVVLMHDGPGKNATLKALPTVLENLKEQGYTFEALDETMEPVRF